MLFFTSVYRILNLLFSEILHRLSRTPISVPYSVNEQGFLALLCQICAQIDRRGGFADRLSGWSERLLCNLT